MRHEISDHLVEAVVIITDHDDEGAERERPQAIVDAIYSIVGNSNKSTDMNTVLNKWQSIEFTGSFSLKISIKYCYLLVPLDSQGALETFMLNALSEKDEARKEVIDQVEFFISNFKSEQYLRKRREQIKAELGISISVFNPERMFDTMMELINQVDWTNFDETEKAVWYS